MSVTCGLDFERQISSTSVETRRAIDESLRDLGFQITVDQLTRIEAKRGGMLGYSLLMKKQMPLHAVFEFSPEDAGCLVAGHLTDNVKMLGKTWGVNRQYREIFDEISRHVDLGLAKLDPTGSGTFAEPRFWSKAADIGLLEQSNALTAKAVGGAVNVAGKALDAPPDTMPKAWKGVDSVTFTSSAGVAVLTLAETQADLGVAVMVVSHPGSMPQNLTHDVERFAGSVEKTLTAAGGRAAQVEVTDAQRPVFEFLRQQGQIRSDLPMRELHICRSCRLEKITNPEYERIAARNEKIGDLVAGVGATIGKGGISPTFVLGQIFKMKRLDPDFVCSRCQGLEADERVVTFCPTCADLQRDVVLRLCSKCGYDFRSTVASAPLWSEPKQSEPEPAAAGASAPEGPNGWNGADPVTDVPAALPAGTVALSLSPTPGSERPPTAASPSERPPAAVDVLTSAAAAASVATAALPAPAPPAPPVQTSWPLPGDVPLGVPVTGKRGGKVCQMCRREYPHLWRVVIATPAGYEERFLCGTTVTCQMPSRVPAVEV
ncbi:MAG: hypothetical protein ACHQ01_11045 [Candidatus Limnocylindrales bacterium]